MTLNRIKNIITVLLLVGCSLSSIAIHAMDRSLVVAKAPGASEEVHHRDANVISPYVYSGASLAVARYAPDIAAAVMPHVAPNYPLLNALAPAAIRYTSTGLSAHFILKNACGINYSDLVKTRYLKKVATNASKLAPLALCHPEVIQTVKQSATQLASSYLSSDTASAVNSYAGPLIAAAGTLTTACIINPNLAPATLCHPQVAQLAAECCTSLASSYVSDSTLQTLDTYAGTAVMAAGALGTLYLVNRNVFEGTLWKKLKRVCKDVRPYLFLAPLATAYNADSIKNLAMNYVPFSGSNLHSDIGAGVKATIYYGSLGTAVYLLATETFQLANQGYVKKHIDKLLATCTDIQARLATLTGRIDTVQSKATALHKGQIKQNAALEEHMQKTATLTKESAELVKSISVAHTKSTQAVEALEVLNTNLLSQALSIGLIATEIAHNIAALKADHAEKLAKFKVSCKEHSQEVLKLIAEKDKEVEEKIAALEIACNVEAVQLEELKPKLAELLQVLKEEGQTYHIDQVRISNITQVLAASNANLDTIIKELMELQSSGT